MFGYAAWGTYRNNIKNLGEAKKIIEKKHDLETTQKVTLENLIKEDSKKVDTILEPFVTYTAEILTTNKDSIKQSIQTNFRFTPNTHIKEKIETESKNFENPAILKDAILKALAVSGDSAKAFTIDELEKKIYNHNPIEATTEYPKFLRKFYSEAIRQLYPLTMSDEKKEYISSDIFSELVDKTKKKMEIHKAQKKQSQDNKVSKADDDKKISGMFAQKPTPP
jgi:malonyl CoA-acyl carrier protein transacylase